MKAWNGWLAITACVMVVGMPGALAQPGGGPGSPPGPPRSFHPPTEEEKEKARERLGITKDQQDRIEALYMDTFKQRQAIDQRIRGLYEQLNNLYDDYDFDRGKAASIRHQITVLRRKLMDIFAYNEEKLRRILNRDQFQKMRALMKEGRERWRRERGQRSGAPQ